MCHFLTICIAYPSVVCLHNLNRVSTRWGPQICCILSHVIAINISTWAVSSIIIILIIIIFVAISTIVINNIIVYIIASAVIIVAVTLQSPSS